MRLSGSSILKFFQHDYPVRVCVCVCVCVRARGHMRAQLCLTLCDSMDCNLGVSSVHGIFQTRRLEWRPLFSPVSLPDPGVEPCLLVSCIARQSSPLHCLGNPCDFPVGVHKTLFGSLWPMDSYCICAGKCQ